MCIFGLYLNYMVFLSEFNENGISSTDFRKHSNTQTHVIPSNESRGVPCGNTNRYDEANSRF